MVIARPTINNAGFYAIQTLGFYASKISGGVYKDESGILYKITENLRDVYGTTVTGGILINDKFTFNFPFDVEVASDPNKGINNNSIAPDFWNQLIDWNKKISFPIESNSGLTIKNYPDYLDNWTKAKATSNGSTTPHPGLPSHLDTDNPTFGCED